MGFRKYQAHACWLALQRLSRGGLILTLPQGTGKTFVSQLIAHEHLRSHRLSKVLVVAPTKELREQYVRMAEWMGYLTPRIGVLDFREPLTNQRKQVRIMVESADIIVTTPELFTNRLSWLSEKSFRSIDLCILDEVDLWLIDDFSDLEANRYHAALLDLKVRLKAQRTHFLGLTASTLSRRGKSLLVNDLGCKEMSPFHESIVKWLPKVQIEPIPCFDPKVIAIDETISKQSFILIKQINEEVGGILDSLGGDFWPFIKLLASGRKGGTLQDLALALLDNERSRLQLFEDGFSGTEKIKWTVKLASRNRPAVVYCREIRLVTRLEKERWPTPPAIAHSGLGDRYLQETLRFKAGDRDILLMTRDLGKRGLDFPMARTLVLCSPKSSQRTMDQELCRTRGQRHHRVSKRVSVLFYSETLEEEKMRRVLRELLDLRMYARFPKFTASQQWTKWIAKRAALTMMQYLRAKSN